MAKLLETTAGLTLARFVTAAVTAQATKPTVPWAGPKTNSKQQLDRTGVRWVLPYQAAFAQAKKQQRLLMVVVTTGGTQPSGCWWPGLEHFRAGPLCDEPVQRLLNRRFIPFYFDMFLGGFAADATARAKIGALCPALEKSIGANPVFFMSPDGAIVAETTSQATTRQVLANPQRHTIGDLATGGADVGRAVQ